MKAEDKYALEALKNIAIRESRGKENHKCYGCKWGTFTGIKYFCMLPSCKPNLGSNGVDKRV